MFLRSSNAFSKRFVVSGIIISDSCKTSPFRNINFELLPYFIFLWLTLKSYFTSETTDSLKSQSWGKIEIVFGYYFLTLTIFRISYSSLPSFFIFWSRSWFWTNSFWYISFSLAILLKIEIRPSWNDSSSLYYCQKHLKRK